MKMNKNSNFNINTNKFNKSSPEGFKMAQRSHIKLIEAIKLMGLINKSKDYNAYFSNGKFVIEENFILINSGR